MPARIEDYAMIGDCETAALVSRDGSIDWLCWPRFDSDACFSALLGGPGCGRWKLGPTDPNARIARRYRGDTLILETEFTTNDGTVVVTDFMPLRDHKSDLIRIARCTRGHVEMKTELELRFDYGSATPWVSRLENGSLRAIAGPDMIVIRSDVPLHGQDYTTVATFTLREGDSASFGMTWSPSHLPAPESADPNTVLRKTEEFWKSWVSHCTYRGDWREPVIRSLITLKGLTYYPTGGIVAAPTTSLPESIGGSRNWDYRFCWLRDATLSLLALMDAGYFREAAAWRDWLLRAAAGSPDQLQILYGLGGERLIREWELPWLPGYENSKPVRIGNAARGQMQLDVYGEVIDALHQARLGKIREDQQAWEMQKALTQRLSQSWQSPDRGIWEVRGEPQQFTHSKVMAWVAVDRMVKSAEQFHLDGPIDDWRALRSKIHAEVCQKGYNSARGCFVQAYGSKLLDASLLFMPLVGFLPATDPRVRSTVECIEKDLLVDGFVLRYDSGATDDGLPAGEGAFLACSFWLADNYILLGRRTDAEQMFNRLLSLRTDLGLLSEEYDPHAKRLVGNFPQAFSHIALLNTAFNLGRAESNAPRPADQRADGHSTAAGC